MSIISAIVRKDLIIEYRSRQTFITTLFFGLLVLVVGNFSLSVAGEQQTIIAPGILWISFLFSGLLFLNHILASEKEENSLDGLLISPATPGQLFLGKMISATIFLVALETILFPVFHILFNFQFTVNSLWLYLVIIVDSVRLLFARSFVGHNGLGFEESRNYPFGTLVSNFDSTFDYGSQIIDHFVESTSDGTIL